MYILGYIPADNRLYLSDKELHVVSFQLLLSVLEYQTAVMRRDFETADRVLPTIPKEQRTRVAHFLEKQGFRQQAMAVSTDPDHKFELAVQLGDLKVIWFKQVVFPTKYHSIDRLSFFKILGCQGPCADPAERAKMEAARGPGHGEGQVRPGAGMPA